jgi:cob(I)alamin adenosyltransferase
VFLSDATPIREKHCVAAGGGLALAREKLADPHIAMVVLDEICSTVALGLLPEQAVLDCLQTAADGKIIVLTGRDAPQALIDLADTVSHIQEVKHGFTVALPAQPGVEF